MTRPGPLGVHPLLQLRHRRRQRDALDRDGECQLVLSGVPGLSSRMYDFYRLLGDTDGRGTVDPSDFSTMISTFLRTPGDPLYLGADDLDRDNTIGASDLSQFTANFLCTMSKPLPK
jgi:hypothetical protein